MLTQTVFQEVINDTVHTIHIINSLIPLTDNQEMRINNNDYRITNITTVIKTAQDAQEPVHTVFISTVVTLLNIDC